MVGQGVVVEDDDDAASLSPQCSDFDITPYCVGVLVSPNESVAFSCWILCVIDCLIVFGLFFDLCSISKIKYDFLHFPCGIECVVFWCCSFTGLEKCFCVTASDVWLRLLVFPPFRCSMSHLLQSMPFLWSVVIQFVHSSLIVKNKRPFGNIQHSRFMFASIALPMSYVQ